MTLASKFSIGFIFLTATIATVTPSALIASSLIAAIANFAFQQWLERERSLKSLMLQNQINDLKDKLETLLISKGIGR